MRGKRDPARYPPGMHVPRAAAAAAIAAFAAAGSTPPASAAVTPPASSAAAPMPFDAIAGALGAVHQFSQVALAPDGRRFVYVEAAGDRSAIRIAEVARPRVVRTITACPARRCDEGDVAWSPDGHRIAFVTTDPKGWSQIAVEDFAAGAARVLTAAKGPLSTPRWSPDGTRLAFLYAPGAPKVPSPLNPSTPDAGVVGSRVYEQRLAIVPAAGGAIRLSARRPERVRVRLVAGRHAPRGTAAHGDGDANWWIAQLYTFDAASGAATRSIIPSCRSPRRGGRGDGKRIAYIGGIMSDEAVTGGDVYVVPSSGGDAVDVTPGLESVGPQRSRGTARRRRSSRRSCAGDRMVIASIDTARRRRSTNCGPLRRRSMRPASRGTRRRHGRVRATRRQDRGDDPPVDQRPPEIAVGAIGAMHDVTQAQTRACTAPPVRRRSITWTSDGRTCKAG